MENSGNFLSSDSLIDLQLSENYTLDEWTLIEAARDLQSKFLAALSLANDEDCEKDPEHAKNLLAEIDNLCKRNLALAFEILYGVRTGKLNSSPWFELYLSTIFHTLGINYYDKPASEPRPYWDYFALARKHLCLNIEIDEAQQSSIEGLFGEDE